MPYTITQGFITQLKSSLQSLSTLLTKAQQSPQASTLPTARLAPDMRSFSYQIFAATNVTTQALYLLSDKPNPNPYDTFADVTYTWDEMHALVNNTLKHIDSLDSEYVLRHADDVRETQMGPNKVKIAGSESAGVYQANVFFHLMCVYAILRKEGVEVGKMDYIRSFVPEGVLVQMPASK